MTEAQEIAANFPVDREFDTFGEASAWLAEHWPDWRDWVGVQQFDNIASAMVKRDA